MKDIKTPNVSHRWEEKKKKQQPRFPLNGLLSWLGSHRCQISVGQQLEKKIAVGSEPMLAFLLQFVCPIRKQLKTHGKLEKNPFHSETILPVYRIGLSSFSFTAKYILFFKFVFLQVHLFSVHLHISIDPEC